MQKERFLISAMFLICALAAGPLMVLAVNPTADFELGPGEYEGMPIPMTSKGSYNLIFSSDGPVTIYIMTQTQFMTAGMSGDFSSYEQKFEGVTSKTVKYDYGDDATEMRYVLVLNEDEEETVNVQVEMDLLETIIDDQDIDAGSVCGSVTILAIAVLAALASLAYILRR